MVNVSQVKQVLKILDKHFPHPGAMELDDSYKTLVAVMLSARTRDEQVLKLLPRFFAQFPTVEELAQSSPKQIELFINTIGMFRQKAKHLHHMAKEVVDRFDGKIPDQMDELVTLAGVGRKTASVVLVVCFHQSAVAVDTHVHRVTNRLGWVKTKLPEQTEQELLRIIPKKMQLIVNRVFVKFGRYICLSGKPKCYFCPIQSYCAFAKKQLTPPKNLRFIQEDIDRREQELESLRRHVL